MAVKFTTLIKMDMNRNAKKEEHLQDGWGCLDENIAIWNYHIEIPCKPDAEENHILVEDLRRKFEEETEYMMSIRNDKVHFSVVASCSDDHVSIEDLYNTVESYTEYLEETLDKHGVKECVLTLELESDISFYIYD